MHELHNFLRGHLSDVELTLLATGDLPSRRQARVDRHLAACSVCRARRSRFEDLFSQLIAYHSYGALSEKLDDNTQRSQLVARLNQMPDEAPGAEIVWPKRAKNRVRAWLPMNPILATGLLLAVASISCVFLWMQQSRLNITSNTLLVRAEAWDRVAAYASATGVIRQTVKITTRKQTLRRTIFRDAEGRRKLREQRLAEDEDSLKRKLVEADISWDAPLSATSYQDWHDAQRMRGDQIQRASGDLLVLTTTIPDGAVASQSLTVRDTDFHPIRRTVSFRDSETVEIAELDYSVLPWTPATSSLFQPEEGMLVAEATRPRPALVQLPSPTLTEEQLNDAELSARLTLNRLHADTGEQIEVARSPHGIEVLGITDSEKRKHELESELYMLPHVTASLSSVEELKAKPSQRGELSSVKVIEMQTQTTPLETYYLAHRRNVTLLGDLAQRLFNSAFAINLESRAIDDLQRRFPQHEGISTVASATLADLLFTHKHKLLAALEDEERLLAEAQIEALRSNQDASMHRADWPLASLAERNLALTRELALGKGGSGRTAEMIASELAASLNELSLQAHEIQVVPQDSTKLDKRK